MSENQPDTPATPATPGTAIVKPTLATLFAAPSARELIEALLPPGMRYETLVATIKLEAKRNPEILKCTGESIVQSTSRILRRGLEPGVNAYLVPFKDTKNNLYNCVDVVGYNGLTQLMLNTKIVRGVEAEAVYAGDHFDYEYGSAKFLRHRPVEDVRERGALRGAYCLVRLPFNNWDFKYVPHDDADAIRKRFSKKWKEGPMPAWWNIKRAVILMAKLMPKSAAWRAVLDVIGEEETEEIEPVVPITTSVNDGDEKAPAPAQHRQLTAPDPTLQPPAQAKREAQPIARTAAATEDAYLLELDEQRFATE